MPCCVSDIVFPLFFVRDNDGSCTFDYVLTAVTLAFVRDPGKVISECARALRAKGSLIAAIIDKNSFLGEYYLRKKGLFYKNAKMLTAGKTAALLKKTGFNKFIFYQNIFKKPEEIKAFQPVKQGYGRGGFVVIRAQKTL